MSEKSSIIEKSTVFLFLFAVFSGNSGVMITVGVLFPGLMLCAAILSLLFKGENGKRKGLLIYIFVLIPFVCLPVTVLWMFVIHWYPPIVKWLFFLLPVFILLKMIYTGLKNSPKAIPPEHVNIYLIGSFIFCIPVAILWWTMVSGMVDQDTYPLWEFVTDLFRGIVG